MNPELASGRWLLDVCWDSRDPEMIGRIAPLCLDRNDPGIIFRDDVGAVDWTQPPGAEPERVAHVRFNIVFL